MMDRQLFPVQRIKTFFTSPPSIRESPAEPSGTLSPGDLTIRTGEKAWFRSIPIPTPLEKV
jgi:hypothetical protein